MADLKLGKFIVLAFPSSVVPNTSVPGRNLKNIEYRIALGIVPKLVISSTKGTQ